MKKFSGSFVSIIQNPLLSLLLTGIFILADYFFFKNLPNWKISFGLACIPLILFAFLRTGLYIFLHILKLLFSNKNTSPLTFWFILAINLLISVFGFYSFFVEPSKITETHIEIQAAGLSAPVRIVQLSDIHVERISRREEQLPELIDKLDPDMIVMTGDFVNKSYQNDLNTQKILIALFNQFHAPLGIYAVNGNVDSISALRGLFAGTNVRLLENETVRFQDLGDHFILIGINDSNWEYDEYILEKTMAELNNNDFTVLLYHSPDIIYAASDLGVDLYLAGHTHGGQVRLPFYGALYANSRYWKEFEMGRYQVGNTILYVNRGIGFSGGFTPRLRFLAPPEVTVIDLVPEEKQKDSIPAYSK